MHWGEKLEILRDSSWQLHLCQKREKSIRKFYVLVLKEKNTKNKGHKEYLAYDVIQIWLKSINF